jgi:hypothetical protein
MRPSRIVIGLILIGLGVLSLLDQTGTIEAGDVIGDWWPVAIVAVGAVQLVEQPRAPIGPLIVIGVGVILLLTQLDFIADDVWKFVWPVALVIVGLIFLLRRPGVRAPTGDPRTWSGPRRSSAAARS